ncbi:MAG TPA: protein translocase subunit SecF, partial [Usitatibacter sp.]|nr:protein translocase subunit SecF [Usitatibacter sp.]
MEFFRIRRTIPFMRHALVFNVISAIVFVIAVVSLATQGLHFSIEFTGGTVLEVSYPHAADTAHIRQVLEKQGIKDAEVLNFGSSSDVMVRLPLKAMSDEKAQNAAMEKQAADVMSALKADDTGATLGRRDYVGGQVGKELATDGALALLFVCIGVVIYLAFRFEWRFAVATIIANLHDVVIILGFFSFFQWEFSLP